MRKWTTKDLTEMAMLAALICVLTFTVKIPVPATNGYTHLGDCMIFTGILLLGWRKGAPAAAVGAAMSDLLGGYVQWMLPTFLIKGAMALIMGLALEKLLGRFKHGWIMAAALGGTVQIAGYTLVKVVYMGGWAAALATTPNIVIQTTAGIVMTAVLVTALKQSEMGNKLLSSQ